MLYILDACSIINLLHIDEDEFLLKKLEKLCVRITPEVFKEVKNNAYKKVNSLPSGKKKYRKYLDTQIARFRAFLCLEKDFLTSDEELKKLTGYSKKNGEFQSTRLAFSISRFNEMKVFFVTDDYPAKQYFQPIFQFHQVGYIEDSVDLLTLLFWLNEDFKRIKFSNFLSKLFSEYASKLNEFLGKLRSCQLDFPKNHIRNPLRNKLIKLIDNIEKYNFEKISSLWDDIENSSKKTFPKLFKILNAYKFILELETTSTNLLTKIKNCMNQIEHKPIYTAMQRN
jgi:hypothetical protein